MSMYAGGPAQGRWARSLLALAVVTTLAGGLSACGGGGGGNTRPTPPAPVSPPPPPPPPTSPPPPPTPQPPIDAHLSLIHATQAEREGYTGAEFRIGIIDSGVNRTHPALAGRVAANLVYVNGQTNDLSKDDVVGHGTTVAQLAAGSAVGQWPGGVAPGAPVLSARIIADERPQDDGSGQGNEVTGAIGIKSIHQDLVARGMRIMNNSWGGLYWNRATATAAIADEYRFFIDDHDGLVVFASGNEGRADPTDMASLPSQAGPNGSLPAADLEKGWLTVAALDTSNPNRLASYSNACGIARDYCLVAPGTAVFTGPDSTAGNISYYYGSGTSYAAPLVSGAAALVWEKFPDFTNDQVRQVLLGTATDLGEPGADAVFGHGLLNVAKALRGPAKFAWGDFGANVRGGDMTWSNPITGEGGLTLDGTHTLTIGQGGASLDYAGDTRIFSGTLAIEGPLGRSHLKVDPFGTAKISAPLGGNVTSAGAVHVNARAAGGGTAIAGDYVQTGDGSLGVFLGDGVVEVGGKARIESGNLWVLGVREGYVSKAREDVLHAQGGVEGRFGALRHDSSIFLQAAIGYDAQNIWLDIDRLDVFTYASAQAGVGPAALAAAQRLETAFDALDGQAAGASGGVDPGFADLAGQFQRITDADQAKASLRSLSGEAHLAATAATFDSLDLGRRALSSRYDQLASGYGLAGGWSQSLSSGGAAPDGAAMQAQGWVVGQDARAGSATFGLAFGETRGDSHSLGLGDRSRERQAQAMAYLGSRGEHAYVLGRIGAGQWQRQLDRHVQIGAGYHGVHSQYGGRFMLGGVEAGWRWQGQAGVLVPYVGAEHAQVDSDAFSEAGAAGFGLRTSGSTASRSQAIAGLRAEHDWGRWSLGSHVEWQQTLASSGLDGIQASFVGVEAWSPMASQAPALSGGLFGLSARARLASRSQLMLDWDQRFGPRGDAQQVSLRYALGF